MIILSYRISYTISYAIPTTRFIQPVATPLPLRPCDGASKFRLPCVERWVQMCCRTREKPPGDSERSYPPSDRRDTDCTRKIVEDGQTKHHRPPVMSKSASGSNSSNGSNLKGYGLTGHKASCTVRVSKGGYTPYRTRYRIRYAFSISYTPKLI